jgi:hypothetical protein
MRGSATADTQQLRSSRALNSDDTDESANQWRFEHERTSHLPAKFHTDFGRWCCGRGIASLVCGRRCRRGDHGLGARGRASGLRSLGVFIPAVASDSAGRTLQVEHEPDVGVPGVRRPRAHAPHVPPERGPCVVGGAPGRLGDTDDGAPRPQHGPPVDRPRPSLRQHRQRDVQGQGRLPGGRARQVPGARERSRVQYRISIRVSGELHRSARGVADGLGALLHPSQDHGGTPTIWRRRSASITRRSSIPSPPTRIASPASTPIRRSPRRSAPSASTTRPARRAIARSRRTSGTSSSPITRIRSVATATANTSRRPTPSHHSSATRPARSATPTTC